VLDLLSIRDPDGISQFEREGDIGLGDLFSFHFQIPFQTIESILRWRMGGCSCSTTTTIP
jgi:hypothetical protein